MSKMSYKMRTEDTTKTTVIVVLGVLLILAVGYIGFNVYQGIRYQQQSIVFQEGAVEGYQKAVFDLMTKAAACSGPVPVIYNNATLNLIALECYNMQSQAPAQ